MNNQLLETVLLLFHCLSLVSSINKSLTTVTSHQTERSSSRPLCHVIHDT